jgi:hypothetical protein
LNDLIADLGQKALHLIVCVIVAAGLPNHAHVVQHFWKQFWNFFWLCRLNLLARLLQDGKAHKVVVCFIVAVFYLGFELFEPIYVRTVGSVQDIDNLLELFLLQAGSERFQVVGAIAPVFNLIKR